ncbi:3-deoxy-D-manno-octulosonic-acid kinase [Bordetella ansorpii]|uniref:3-deoxy-D-manno-octulosonic acid kinase n=1 Tax=Bordetella ansorpii TaxID=288768 RepID=A0A157SCE9_9BORD|nr:3-deoxy-D-manno-octulosonic-acid kinase [Bordetella ansorpii]
MPADAILDATRQQAWPAPADGAMLWNAARLGDTPPARWFDPEAYGGLASPVAAGGRQAAWMVAGQGWQGVLRGYRRGGLVARISRESYAWRSEDRTRSFREYRLLAALHAQGLRVPVPLAAGYWRRGWSYRAAILVERVPDVRPLAHALDASPDEVAGAIARMHRAGVWHADLNAFNILLDAQGHAWLIDFDRGKAGGLSNRARAGNLLRLRRSLRKVAGEQGEACWRRLQAAYARAWSATA